MVNTSFSLIKKKITYGRSQLMQQDIIKEADVVTLEEHISHLKESSPDFNLLNTFVS